MKTYKAMVVALTLPVIFFAPACKDNCIQGSGTEKEERRQLTAFNQLDVSGSFNITLVQDSTNSVRLTADDNIVGIIKTEISGDKLKISTDKNVCNSKPIAIILGVRNLKSIESSGSNEFVSNERITLGDLKLELSGATTLNLDLVAANIETEASGVTDITLKGQARSHNVDFSGSGELHAFDLITGNYSIESSGQNSSEINVLNELNINTTGAADIKYKGTPAKIKKDKTGAFSLTKIE